ncbi:MAG: hypothetical protein J0M12_03900 [Deltaproteobacteria bacterium]|nr:hypothetical protein [Deltaproteobacteria bacterium]
MLKIGPIGLEVGVPVTAHPTTDALRHALQDLFTTTLINPNPLEPPQPGLSNLIEVKKNLSSRTIDQAVAKVRHAREAFAQREILAHPQKESEIQQSLANFLSTCTDFSTAVHAALGARKKGEHASESEHVNTAWLNLSKLEDAWLRIEYSQILEDPLSGKNLPSDPYRWLLGISPNSAEASTKGLRFENSSQLQLQAEENAHKLQELTADLRKKLADTTTPISTADARAIAVGLRDIVLALGEFLPVQFERIVLYKNQLLPALPRRGEQGVDPVVYVFAQDICTLKLTALQKMETDLRNLFNGSKILNSVAERLAGSDEDTRTAREVLPQLAEDFEFISMSIAARLRLSDPLFLGTQKSFAEQGPVDPITFKQAQASPPLPPNSGYFDAWGISSLMRVVDSRIPVEAMNASMRAAGYGTEGDGILWPTFMEVATQLMTDGDPLAAWQVKNHEGARIFRGWVRSHGPEPLGVWQHEGAIVEEWKIDPNKPALAQKVLEQIDLLQHHARLELVEKGTTLGEHRIPDRMSIQGAKFITLERGDREVGFCYMFVDPEHIPDKAEIARIPKNLLPAGRPARPNLIVVSEEASSLVEKGAAYTALMDTMENIARECGCDYMIARVNLHEGSRGWRAAERRGWRKIDAFVTGHGVAEGKETEIQQQWIVKDLA